MNNIFQILPICIYINTMGYYILVIYKYIDETNKR